MALASDIGDDKSTLGINLKLLRTKKRLSAKALAEAISVSPSLISKIEAGATNPSMDVLRKIVMYLQVNLADLMGSESAQKDDTQGRWELGQPAVVRANERKLLRLPQRGITYQMLTPDAQGPAEFMWVEMGPGDGGVEFFAHKKGEESVLVLEGTLNVYIGSNVIALNQGDCVTFDATQLHMYRNEGKSRVVWLYLAVPPTV